MHTEEIDIPSLTDAQIDELNAFENLMGAEAYPEDPPQPDEQARIGYRTIPDFVKVRQFIERDDGGRIIGFAGTRWFDEPANRHILHAWLGVQADHRRQGVGRRLLGAIVDAADEANKTLLMGGTNDRRPEGEAFMRRLGAQGALEAHTNRLVLAGVDRDMVRRWIDEGPTRAPGYSLVAIDGPYPDELIEQIIDLHSVMNTAPRGDLDMEDSHWTVDQMRKQEESMLANGLERWYLAARHDESGELVGWTEVGWAPHMPQTVWQWGTGVRPAHRGHALGKWLKAVMLERVFIDRPDVKDVRTGNADSNAPMLGINKALGFEHYIAEISWQIPVEKVRAYLKEGVKA
jgi:GNAT superfamily N-acetyltransferase